MKVKTTSVHIIRAHLYIKSICNYYDLGYDEYLSLWYSNIKLLLLDGIDNKTLYSYKIKVLVEHKNNK